MHVCTIHSRQCCNLYVVCSPCCRQLAAGRLRTSTRRTLMIGRHPTCQDWHQTVARCCEFSPGCPAVCRRPVPGDASSGTEATPSRWNNRWSPGLTWTISTLITRTLTYTVARSLCDSWASCSTVYIATVTQLMIVALCALSGCVARDVWVNTASNRHHWSNGDCLEGKRGNCQVCSVQYCVQQLCTVQCTHIWTVLTVLWIGFCPTGPISLCLDSFLFMHYCVYYCMLHAYVES